MGDGNNWERFSIAAGVAVGTVAVLGLIAGFTLGRDSGDPSAAPTTTTTSTTTSTTTAPAPFDFDSADAVIDDACREVRDVNQRAITAAGEAYDRGTFTSIPGRADMIADAEVIRLRRAALAAEVARLEVPTLWQVAEPITVLALAAAVYPDDVIVDELLFSAGAGGGSVGLEEALDRALEACQDR